MTGANEKLEYKTPEFAQSNTAPCHTEFIKIGLK